MGVASHSATNASGTDTVNQQTEEKTKENVHRNILAIQKNVNHKSTYQVHLDYIKHHVEIIVSSMTNWHILNDLQQNNLNVFFYATVYLHKSFHIMPV